MTDVQAAFVAMVDIIAGMGTEGDIAELVTLANVATKLLQSGMKCLHYLCL